MDSSLRARLIRRVPSDEGMQGDILFTEVDGREMEARCLVRVHGRVFGGTDLSGDGRALLRLEQVYGADAAVCFAAQGAVLGI